MEMEVTAQQIVEDIHIIKNSLTKLETRFYSIHTALTGSDITKDGGLIGRIIESEKELAMLTVRVETVERKESQRRLYIRIIYGAVGFLLALAISYLAQKFK